MNAPVLIARADGRPQPQGSTTVYRGHVTSANKNLKPWRARVTTAVIDAMTKAHLTEPWDGPVHVMATFYVPKPPTARRTTPTVRPDLDKYLRAVLDSLTTAGLIHDDGQVTSISATKRYATDEPGYQPGVLLVLSPIKEKQP